MRRFPRLRHDDGHVLITVSLVSMLVGMLAAVALTTARASDVASARDRNSDTALGVAEAGVHQAVAKIEAQAAISYVTSFSFSGATAHGTYEVSVARSGPAFVVDSTGTTGGATLSRARRIRATLRPPRMFADQSRFALFSDSPIELKNNDVINGDVWSNGSILAGQNIQSDGSMTAARGWVKLENGARVAGNVWSGGYNDAEDWAINLDTSATIGGWAKASVAAPSDPQTCGGEAPANYNVSMASGSSVAGNVTTLGAMTGAGSANVGSATTGVCTPAAATQPLPAFTFNRNNYDPATYHEFSTVADFQYWLNNPPANGDAMQGTFVIQDLQPSQDNRIDLTGTSLAGDTTIITNAPIFTSFITDTAAPNDTTFVLVSHYDPPTGTACNVNQDRSECAIHVKNDMDISCRTAALIYADLGPIAVKNNQKMCGRIIGDGILIKNNQSLDADARLDRRIGFGSGTYEIALWEELPT